MNKRHKIILFLMFCLSGFCGLAYQIVWLRKAFAVFGVITPVISVVVSVFMLGLFIGSWAGGRWIKTITGRFSVSAIYLYAVAEFVIGLGGVSVPYLFLFGDRFLLPMGNTGSFTYLLFSGLVIAFAMLPWCIFMGATYPFMMAFLEEHYQEEKNGFSFLYLANVIGAMTGTLFTALFLIEIFGFQHTLFIAACMNFTVTLLAVLLGISFRHKNLSVTIDHSKVSEKKHKLGKNIEKPSIPYLTRTILFITGFSSMGMEVIWTRAFTPALGTLIYSFAALLFTYLLATCIGSYLYRRHRDNHPTWGIPILIAMLAISAFLPVVFTDWRVPLLSRLPVLNIFPLCFLLGYLTPKLIDEYSGGDPEKAGKVYAINIAGCVLGPLFASYLLLPFFGSRISIIILSLPLLWLFIRHWGVLRSRPIWRVILTPVLIAVLLCSLFVSISFEEGFNKINGVIRHDYTATVVSFGNGLQKKLLVNGIGMTVLTPLTKDMAHMPLVSLNHKPENALAICLGMGTTLRSLASWGIDVTAVELVPSVKEAFGYYHADADRVLSQPNVRIVVDDGRRFLRRTEKKFDVITIDPPPPIQAAGSSLLYSEEFYSLIRTRLKPGGILQQWFPEGEESSTLAAVTTSLTRSFPYVLMYRSVEGWGYHYLASMIPIHVPTATEAILRMPEAAKKDRLEWEVNSEARLTELWNELINGKVEPALFTKSSDFRITDDRPFNEYYLLRYFKKLNFKSFVSWITGLSKSDSASVGPFFIRNNSYADAYNSSGTAYAKLGQSQRAIEDFNQAIRLQPDDAMAYNNRGAVYCSIGQYQLAIEDYNQAIRLQPDDVMAYNNRGAAYYSIGQYQSAIEDYTKVIRITPDDSNAYNNRGVDYTQLGQYPLAIDDFNKAISLKSNYADAYANRGFTYFNQGNKKLGCPDAKKACEWGDCKLLEFAKGKGVCL
jgi:tetratricopeptide (TPR) repeat protein/predicted membrane-bound spermidine synthase